MIQQNTDPDHKPNLGIRIKFALYDKYFRA